ncbi:MAG: hypothetical protein KGI33_12935, partial [Thaumarchaeota archaeon]|nr:hypothetical protein [Nitrososphaerota archaeon]
LSHQYIDQPIRTVVCQMFFHGMTMIFSTRGEGSILELCDDSDSNHYTKGQKQEVKNNDFPKRSRTCFFQTCYFFVPGA